MRDWPCLAPEGHFQLRTAKASLASAELLSQGGQGEKGVRWALHRFIFL